MGDAFILDKIGFESSIWENERKLVFENSVGDNDVLVVRNRMESFEFLSLLQNHGMPNIMGILTHLDYFRENKAMRKTKKKMKKRFWKEVHDGAKLFYFSGQ